MKQHRGKFQSGWIGLLAVVALLAGLYWLDARQPSHPAAGLPVPTVTRVQPSLSPTSAPSQTRQPQATATRISRVVTATPLVAISNSSVLNTKFPTSLPIVLDTPPADVETYRLKPWTEQKALQALKEAEDSSYMQAIWKYNQALGSKSLTPTPTTSINTYTYSDEYFYEQSLLYELILRFPNLSNDPGLNGELLGLNLNTNFSHYGYVHDASVQPLANLIEVALNQGQVQFNADSISTWLGPRQMSLQGQPAVVNNLFGDGSPAMVIQVEANGLMAMFAIQQNQGGTYSVIPLYPKFGAFYWGQETFQVLDVNGDGRAEVAISDSEEGIGSSHFCEKNLSVYEWNGSAFHDLMENYQVETADVDGACSDPTFIPGQNGAMVIVTETDLPTDCDNQYYTVRTLYYWDGKGFKGSQPQPSPPLHNRLDMCAISWAIIAGPQNSQAAQILASALYPWPQDAVNEWGPASRDYFSLKLATWYIRLGQLNQGIALLHSIASAPHTPDYPIPALIADTFLRAYASGGMYRAVQAVGDFYQQELDKSGTCAGLFCNIDQTRSQWGFAENTWQYGFYNDFGYIDGLQLSLQAENPKDLDEFKNWLNRNQIQYQDLQQVDLNGDGRPDWLGVITFSENQDDGNIYKYIYLYAFLNTDTGILPLEVQFFTDIPPSMTSFQHYLPTSGAEEINVFQADQSLFAFRFHKTGDVYNVIEDLPTDMLQYSGDSTKVIGWNIVDTPQGQALEVQYIAAATGTYIWDSAQGKLVPTGLSPDLQEQNIGQIEQALYVDNDPGKALPLLNGLLRQTTMENYGQDASAGSTIVPRIRPYLLYLRGLAYELSGDAKDAVSAYWQLWQDYPADPFALIAQRKLEPDK